MTQAPDLGIVCPCKIGSLRVVKKTPIPGGNRRILRCAKGHRVVSFEFAERLLSPTPRQIRRGEIPPEDPDAASSWLGKIHGWKNMIRRLL